MEGDAGTDPVNSTEDDAQQTADTATEDREAEIVATDAESPVADPVAAESAPGAVAADPAASRLGRGWLVGVCAVLLVLAAGLGFGGYLGFRYQASIRQLADDNAAALAAAEECVLATQAPDTGNVAAAQQKIFECTTGEFRTQAALYAEMFVQAYRAAKVHVALTEMAAAVERDNPDGSVDVLVAFRVKVDNVEAQDREVGYRLRAQMMRDEGVYRIAKLDQVAR